MRPPQAVDPAGAGAIGKEGECRITARRHAADSHNNRHESQPRNGNENEEHVDLLLDGIGLPLSSEETIAAFSLDSPIRSGIPSGQNEE
jgi:hypothetical protein